MRALLLWSVYFLLPHLLNCADMDSYEVNRLEITPIYDIILFNDIADVINDIESGMNSQAEIFTESDSNENVEDLLLEYQHYLDKAHKQRLDYLDKVSGKNKVPPLRHDKYPKKKTMTKSNYADFYKPLSKNIQPSANFFSNMDGFLPQFMRTSHFSYGSSTPHVQKYKQILPFETDYAQNKNQVFGTSYNSQQLVNYRNLPSSCYCKTNEIPCKCGCKQCLVTFSSDPNTDDLMQIISNRPDFYADPMLEKRISKDLTNINENDLKVRIKIDIKLPKIFETFAKLYENKSTDNKFDLNKILTNYSPTNLFSPYLKPSSAMDLLGYNGISGLSGSMPLQRITIHKKKKTKTNSNKKHRKKPFFMHDINVGKNSSTIDVSNKSDLAKPEIFNKSVTISNESSDTIIQITSTRKPIHKTEKSSSKEFIYVTLNISNNENHTDDIMGTENSIETEEFNTKENKTIPGINIRDKREAKLSNVTHPIVKKNNNTVDETRDYKLDKILNDPSLLYWAENASQQFNNQTKSINALILNTEKEKTKFNMSKENMRLNHSMALEKAIFGDVDWNDIDTVAPMFISFVGKYVKGVLTFCSDVVCHSMKCAEKSCIHRKCDPANRYNKIGHCLGTNSTDSIAKIEHAMDLPSNVAFEVVDILKDKMIAKMFGKMTICIGIKCITFVATKKTILKSKCTSKELTSKKECPFVRKY